MSTFLCKTQTIKAVQGLAHIRACSCWTNMTKPGRITSAGLYNILFVPSPAGFKRMFRTCGTQGFIMV